MHRLDLDLYSHPKEFGENGARNHVSSKGKIPSTGGSEEVRTRDTQDSEPNTLPTELFQPFIYDLTRQKLLRDFTNFMCNHRLHCTDCLKDSRICKEAADTPAFRVANDLYSTRPISTLL